MKIVFHDVDGCLNAGADSPIPVSGSLSAIQTAKLKELGRKIDASTIDHLVINTGRSIEETLFLTDAIASEKLQYVIAEHGAVYRDIFNDNPLALSGSMTATLDLMREFISWYRQTGAAMLNKRIGTEVPILEKVANLTLDARDGLDTRHVYEELKAVVKSEAPVDYELLEFHHNEADAYVDVLGQIHKGHGMEVITPQLSQITSHTGSVNSIAIGNGLNDMPMLRAATTIVCPANSEPEVLEYCRARSGFVSEHGYIDATLHWLEKHL